MAKDWNGNAGSIFKTLGASNHTENERPADDDQTGTDTNTDNNSGGGSEQGDGDLEG